VARAAKRAVVEAGPLEEPWELPDGWRWERLQDVATINPKTELGVSGNEPITFVGMAAVSEENGRVDVSVVRPASQVAKGFTRFQCGDVLFAKITPCMENGKIAVVPELASNVGAGSTEFHVVRPDSILARFLFHFLVQRDVRQEARRNMSGTAGQMRVPTGYLRLLPVPVPPLKVQEGLVDRIDELLAEIDDGEYGVAAARDAICIYNEAILQAAVTGRLTADWRSTSVPADDGLALLKEIEAEKALGKAQGHKRGRQAGAEGPETKDLSPLPDGWTWANLEMLSVEESRNGLSIKEAREPTQVRALRLDALAGERVDWTRCRYLPRLPSEVQAYRLHEGDLLVSRANGSPRFVGRAALCSSPPSDMIYPDTAIRYRIGPRPDLAQWVLHAWNSPQSRKQIEKRAKTTAGILKISQGDIRAIPIPVPGRQEIAEINRRVAALWDDTDPASDAVSALTGSLSNLRQSILAAAFRGDLIA
jgi:type I restriction enzyme S subunit